MSVVVIRRRTFRTGLQSLTYEDGVFYMSIRNRSYRSKVPVPSAHVERWKAYFDA